MFHIKCLLRLVHVYLGMLSLFLYGHIVLVPLTWLGVPCLQHVFFKHFSNMYVISLFIRFLFKKIGYNS